MSNENVINFTQFEDVEDNDFAKRKLSIISQTPNEMIVKVSRVKELSEEENNARLVSAATLNNRFNEISSSLSTSFNALKSTLEGDFENLEESIDNKFNDLTEDVNNSLSQKAGTLVSVKNESGTYEPQDVLYFDSNPQTQITNEINNRQSADNAINSNITNITNNTVKIKNTSNGFASGNSSSATSGGAIGNNAVATSGFSGGNNAKSTVDAIQLGMGTNTTAKSLQVYNDNLFDANSHKLGPALLNAIYPVGSVYISVDNTQNPEALFGGKWVSLEEGYALWTTTTTGTGGQKIAAGLPNITGSYQVWKGCEHLDNPDGVFANSYTQSSSYGAHCGVTTDGNLFINFDASESNSIYGNSTTVQPPAIRVFAWRRTE